MRVLKIGLIKILKSEFSQYQLDICSYIISSNNLELEVVIRPHSNQHNKDILK